MEPGSGSEGIGTKSLSQSPSERLPALAHVLAPEPGHALERASALERAVDLAFPPAPASLSFLLNNDEGPSLARALTRKRAVALERTRVLQPIVPIVAVPQNQQPIDVDAVLADSDIMEIINSIGFHRFARVLRLHAPQTKHEHSWLSPIIAPITRLPLELLQQILLIVIDEVSDPPSVLMYVCKYWHVVVTGIWASLPGMTSYGSWKGTSRLWIYL